MSRLARFSYILLTSFLGACGALPEPGDVGPRTVSSLGSESLGELEEEAKSILAKPHNLAIRGRLAPVFELAKRYAEAGESAKAITYYTEALKHKPWNLEAQLALARLLNNAGEGFRAKKKAELVWTYAETDALLIGAAELLGKQVSFQFPAQEPDPEPYGLVLVPYEEAERWLVLALRDDLSRILGIPVTIREVGMELRAPARYPLHRYATDLRKLLVESARDENVRALLRQRDLSHKSLAHDEDVFLMTHTLLEAVADNETVRQFEEKLSSLRLLGPQWNAVTLVGLLAAAVEPRGGSGTAYLGVTEKDLYGMDNRYVFGLAFINGNCGVFSYRRYTSALSGTPPNRERLKERALKQSLSSIGLMFGLPRCTDPTCTRAYVNSLAEHDAKQVKFCRQCEEGFLKRFGKEAG